MFVIIFFLSLTALPSDRFASAADSAVSPSLELNLPQQLTADLSSEISPSISTDGRWLLYASNRSGNYDLWIRPAEGGIPTQLTTHPADDYSPAWSPRGNKICFVSTRDDPRGDLYILNVSVRSGKPRAARLRTVAEDPGTQNFPSFSRNGKFIVYQDGNNRESRIAILRLGKKGRTWLTDKGYLQPRFSPLSDHILCIRVSGEENASEICIIEPGHLKAPAPQINTIYGGSFPPATPCWSPDGQSFCASLVNKDRDRDGFLTAQDGQALYRFDRQTENFTFRTVSIGDASDMYPYWAHDGYIYYSSDARGNLDLWRITEEGPIPPADSHEAAFQMVHSIGLEAEITNRPLNRRETSLKLLAFERVRTDFPDARQIGVRSMLESARLLNSAGEPERSVSFLMRIPRLYPGEIGVRAEAEIDFQLQAHDARSLPDDRLLLNNPVSFITNLNRIISRFPNQTTSLARAHFLIGQAFEQIGDVERALASYRTVVDNYPEAGDHPAEALLRIAAIYSQLGSGEEALVTYLDEISRFSHRPLPTKKAISKVIETRVRSDEPIAGLQDLIGRYPDLPAIAAAAQLRIADVLAQADEVDLALGEYERLQGYASRHPIPYVETLFVKALIASAKLEERRGEYVSAHQKLEEVQNKFASLADGFYARRARFLSIKMFAERAERLSRSGDWELALANYEKALAIDPQDVRLNRGKIAAAQALGNLDDVIEAYRDSLLRHPDDPVYLYALGLCLSYRGKNGLLDLRASNDYIQEALAKDPNLTYGYLTLGYNYEVLENLTREDAKPSGNFVTGLYRTVGDALIRLGRLFTFKGEPPPLRGYEKAIETLQLGIAVNNEADNPDLEADMLLNLGNNYYRLGEFGYPRALSAYLTRLRYDSTFASPLHEALIRERMGQAAAIGGKNELAMDNYRRARELYHRSKHFESELRVLLRLAELYQVLNDAEQSTSYYREAIRLAERENFDIPRTKWWENMAFNALSLGDDLEILDLTEKALSTLPADSDIPSIEYDNPLILEILGVPIPIWNFGFLGTGSPMSAVGFGLRDELLLNYSISQNVHTLRKDLAASMDIASKRLAIALRRSDQEAESILWSEIGFLHWAEGSLILAHRCFRRSLSRCEKHGLRAGKLSAMINLGCLAVNRVDVQNVPSDIYFEESAWFAQYGIGFNEREWQEIRSALLKLEPGLNPTDVKNKIRRILRPLPEPEGIPPDPLDWNLLEHLLLLNVNSYSDMPAIREVFAGQLAEFQKDPVGFSRERIRFYEIYAQICLKIASLMPENSPADQFQRLELEGEAFWAFRQGISEAEDRGFSDLTTRIRIELSDFLFSQGDFEGSSSLLITSLNQTKTEARDDLVWRIHWRLGRNAMKVSGSALSVQDSALQRVSRRPVEEWFELAGNTYFDLPSDQNDLGGMTQAKLEARALLELAALYAIKEGDHEEVLKYAQLITQLPLLHAVQSRVVPVQFERRKFIWGERGGTVPYLREEMQRLKREVAKLRSSAKTDTAVLNEKHRELVQIEDEYFNILEEEVRDDPEFASLFTPVTYSLDSLHGVLDLGDLIIQVLNLSGEYFYLLLNKDSISCTPALKLPLPDRIESSRFDASLDFLQAFFSPIQEPVASASRLYLILPESWAHLPFERYIVDLDNFTELPAVHRLPDLQSLVILRNKPSFGKGQNILISEEFTLPNFYHPELGNGEPVKKTIENSATLLLDPLDDRVAHLLDVRLFSVGDKLWRVKDLFGIQSNSDVLILRGDFEDEALLAKIGFFAGFANVLFISNTVPQSDLSDFLKAFLALKENQSPGIAFDQAMRTLVKARSNEALFGTIRYYGNGGLNLQQRRDFAGRNFAATVLKGNYNLENGDGAWALRYYDRALTMADEIGDLDMVANLHNLRIKAARLTQNWVEASRSQAALNEFAEQEGDLGTLETGLRNLSVYYANMNQDRQAIEVRLQAREMAENRGDEIRAATDDQILATFYEKVKDYQSAEQVIRRAQQIFFDWEETDEYVASGIYLGRLYLVQEDFGKAARWLEQLEREIHRWQGEIEESIAIPAEYYQHLGLAYEGMSDYNRALSSQQRALGALEDTLSAATAFTHQYLSGLYWKMGRYQDALDHLNQAKEQFGVLRLNQYIYLAENTEALIYLNLGESDHALDKAKSALEGAITSGDEKSRSQIKKNIGLIELARNEPGEAKQRFLDALTIDRKLNTLTGQAYAYVNLGNAYLQLGDLDSSQINLEAALESGIQLSDPRIVARSYLGLGRVQIEHSEPRKALGYLSQAEDIARQRGFKDLVWRIGLATAKAKEREGRTQEALNVLKEAMQRIEAMRAGIASEDLKSGFMEDKGQIYALAVSLYLKQNDPIAALDITERSRSRSFLDMLQSRPMDERFGLDHQTEANLKELSSLLSKLRADAGWLQGKGTERSPEEDEQMQRDLALIDSLETAYTRLLQDIESLHPGYRDLVQVEPEPAEKILSSLAADEAIVEYFFLADELAIFTLRSDGIRAEVIPITQDSLAAMTSTLRYRLEKRLLVQDESRALYRWLIEPIERQLGGINRLIIVPAAPLHYLPFASLEDEEETYLIDKFTLSVSPSASVFLFCRERALKKPSISSPAVLALTNPEVDLPLESLFFAEKEAITLSDLFPGTEILQGSDATETKLNDFAPNTEMLHIACHGLFDASNPKFSSLMLAPDDGSDGRLEMHEIFNLHLDDCSLITLSACESGLGGIAGGDEIIGLNRAFMYAGSPRIVSTLWKVDDLSTAVLMKRFYRDLRAGLEPAAALQRAQQHIRQRLHAHPAYWAAFILTGEPGIRIPLN